MKAEFKKRWVEALRSGKYVQTQGTLRDQYGFCCLGVALDLKNPEGWAGQPSEGNYEYAIEDDGETYVLLAELEFAGRRIVGLTDAQEGQLITMNDGWNGDRAHTFAEIADWIEANIKTREGS